MNDTMNIYVDLITKGIKALNDYFQKEIYKFEITDDEYKIYKNGKLDYTGNAKSGFDFIYGETYIASEYSKESKNV